MSDETKIQQLYPANKDDLESEKEILDAIVKVQPLEIQFKLLAVNSNLLKLKNLESNEQLEISAKDAETARKFQPATSTINAIVAGTHKLADDELANIEKYLTPEELAKKDELLSKLAPLPDYWLKCIQNHGVLKQAVNEDDDVEVLKHLTGVEYKMSEDASAPLNFTLIFHFSENPFFTNQTLSVTLHLKEPREATKIIGTELAYKEGKNLTKKVVEKKQKK
jgi:nucleosome assembly protein 1-like 1